jgi:hypothetical protein
MSRQLSQLLYETNNFKKEQSLPFDVNPEFAAELLNYNVDNRRIREIKVNIYANKMSQGAWVNDGTPLVFTKSGKIISAQHRLLAVIKSGTTQRFRIQTGVPEEAFNTIDTNETRNGSDVAGHLGYKNQHAVSTIARFMVSVEGAKANTPLRTFGNRVDNSQLSDWLKNKCNDELMIDCVNDGQKFRRKFQSLSGTFVCSILYYFSQFNKDAAWDFVQMLCTGEGCSSTKNSAVYLLRQRLINVKAMNGLQMRREQKLFLFIKAFNLFVKRREVKKLSLSVEDEYIRPISI